MVGVRIASTSESSGDLDSSPRDAGARSSGPSDPDVRKEAPPAWCGESEEAPRRIDVECPEANGSCGAAILVWAGRRRRTSRSRFVEPRAGHAQAHSRDLPPVSRTKSGEEGAARVDRGERSLEIWAAILDVAGDLDDLKHITEPDFEGGEGHAQAQGAAASGRRSSSSGRGSRE